MTSPDENPHPETSDNRIAGKAENSGNVYGPVTGVNLGTIYYQPIPPPTPPTPPTPQRWFEPPTVPIPAGEFLMGNNNGTKYEQPQHPVYLADYAIGSAPVTNRQYAAYIQATRCLISPTAMWNGQNPPPDLLDLPVKGISFFDALAYCTWLHTQTGRLYRMPNEAEWEKAARNPLAYGFTWGMLGEWTCSLWGISPHNPDLLYTYPWQDDNRNDVHAGKHVYRVVRGAARTGGQQLPPHASTRSGAPPDQPGPPGNRYGFRVVMST